MIMAPEITISSTAFLILISDLFSSKKSVSFIFALLAILAATFFALGIDTSAVNPPQILGGRFIVDSLSLNYKFVFLITAFVSIVFTKYQSTKITLNATSEYLILLLFCLTGMMFLVSSTDLITLFLSLELATIPLILLSAWNKHKANATEAALKYVMLAAFSSSLMLFGLSIVYGLTGTMEIQQISHSIVGTPLYFALALLFAGAGFKLTLFPFHQWSPDVYEQAPTGITSFLSVASKAAGLAFFLKIFYGILGPIHQDMQNLFIVAAVVTMTFGNLVAIKQTNIKRFMAYSSISHGGFIFMGLLNTSELAQNSIVFFLFAYLVSNLTVFGVITFFESETGKTDIKDYAGLSTKRPAYALAMLIALFSLSGIPPLAGFLGKFYLMNIAAVEGLYWLVGVAAINSTIALYYYLQIIRQMYVNSSDLEITATAPKLFNTTLLILTIATVVLGVYPFKV